MNATPHEKLEIDHLILAWFKARGMGWQDELNGVRKIMVSNKSGGPFEIS
jgi:uncharacterized protein (DUF4415 family)